MQKAQYVRLYSDENGDSHFEDLEVPLVPLDFAPPTAPLNIAQFLPATQTLWVGAHVGWAGEEPHPSPRRMIFCVVQGEWEATSSDGTVRAFPVGSVLLLEDTTGKGHSTRITSQGDALVFAVVLADPD
ncbi:MAG: hypothetical protein IIB29_09190 [Chloroflexi bacterium]|nr:hypothetical protein [Chloroflexota bacterium]